MAGVRKPTHTQAQGFEIWLEGQKGWDIQGCTMTLMEKGLVLVHPGDVQSHPPAGGIEEDGR